MTIGIVGATGNLGSLTVEALLDRGIPAGRIVALVRSPVKAHEFAKRGVDVRYADYDDPTSLHDSFAGVNRLLLIPTFAPPAARTIQHQNALDAARDTGVGHVYCVSFLAAHLDAKFKITPAYLFAESSLRVSGLAWTILRNSLYAEPILDWIPDILEMGTIPYPTGDRGCSYVSRADLACATAGALAADGHEGRVYELTGPEALTTEQLCDTVSRVTGRTVVDRGATDADYVEASRGSVDSDLLMESLLTLYHTVQQGYFERISNDIESLSGVPPQTFEKLLESRLNS